MTATQAPTPGPLTAESVKLLVKGDLLMLDGQPVRFLNLFMGGIRADDGSDKRISALPPDRFAFIGRPDESGWMPWSGSENPFGQTIVSVRLATGAEVTKRADHFPKVAWSNIITHALAPTAPVEASGSDWKQAASGKRLVANLASYCGGETPGCTDISPCCDCLKQANVFERGADPFGAYVTHLGDLLRPQPSGETREAVAEAQRELDRAEAQDHRTVSVRIGTMRALLSARPLALGGQQGDSETLRVLLDNLVIAQTMSKDIRQKATDEARSYLYDRRHTPARAEAQDEGAAGEPVGHIRGVDDVLVVDWAQNVMPPAGTALYAHPSPTPAADADRVLDEAAKYLKAQYGATYGLDHPRDRARILATLKSTAAKEGGE